MEVEARVLTTPQAVADLLDIDPLVMELIRDEHFGGLAVREGENQVALVPEDLVVRFGESTGRSRTLPRSLMTPNPSSVGSGHGV